MFDYNNYITNCGYSKYGICHIPHIECVDGFKMSVQIGWHAYCSPRNNTGPYDTAEIGYPSEVQEEIMEYVEDPENPTDTVYGWVPIEIINALVDKHGGIKE